ncbi:hypothetical protein BsWGS_07525 [Bradybaena similaris]
MPHRCAPQNAGQQGIGDEIGVPKMRDGAESRSQVFRLISTGTDTQKQCKDTNPRDETDFFSPTPYNQSSRTSRKSEDPTHAILSRHQRSQSVGSAKTCYVVHDNEGKPVLRLITNGFAINRKLGEAAVLREQSQTSGSSSRNVYKETLLAASNEEIVLMLGDSAKAGISLANVNLEEDGVKGKGEQFQSDRKKQASGRRRRKKRASEHVYGIENQDSEANLGSFRRHNSRRRDSKDSVNSFENIQGRRTGNTTSSDINEYESHLGLHRQKKHKLGPRSQAYAMKSEEFLPFRSSKNRNARLDAEKNESAMTSYEQDTTQEPRSDTSIGYHRESEAQEDAVSGEEDEGTRDTTASASEMAATPKKGGGGGKKASTPKAKGAKGSVSEASTKGGPTPSASKAATGKKSDIAAGGKDKKKSVKAEEADKDKKKSIAGDKDKKKSKADAGERKASEGGKDNKKGKDKKKKSKAGKEGRGSSMAVPSSTSITSGSRPGSISESESRAEVQQPPSVPPGKKAPDASAVLGQSREETPADKGKKSKKSKSGSKADLSEATSEGNTSDNQPEAKRKSDAQKAGKDKKRKDSKPGKDKKDKGKDKPKKGDKAEAADKKKGGEATPGDESAGMVQGLSQETSEEGLAPAPRESIMTNTSPPMYSDETSKAATPESTSSWPGAQKEQPSEPESEDLGTIIYQHVARYMCVGVLRVAGGVRVLFDVAEKQAYVQLISPLCEPFVTYYLNNMTFLTSTSAAGVAWAGAVHRKKNSKSDKKDDKSDKKDGKSNKKDDKQDKMESKPGTEPGSPKKGGSDEKSKTDKDRYSEDAIKARLERCNLPEMSKTVIGTAHVVFCDPYQAQRFRTVLETLKSAVECSNCLIMPCIAGNSNLTFPAPPVVPCTIVDPICAQRQCIPPLPPSCCSMPFCPPNPNMQFQQPFYHCLPGGLNPCLGAPNPMERDLCGQLKRPFNLQCPDALWNEQYPCQGQRMHNPEVNQGQPRHNPPDYNFATANPSLGNTPGLWSGFSTPDNSQISTHPTQYPSQNQYQQYQMLNQNDRISQPPSPLMYPQGGGGGRESVRFNPNVQYKQPSQQDWINSNVCANAVPDAEIDCYDPYSFENCFGKTLFCAPGCLVRLSSDLHTWIDLQKGCVKIFQCPNNGGYSLVLEDSERAITIHHNLTAEMIFTASEKTQFGFNYTTVTRSENRGTLSDHWLVSFMNCRSAEQFKCLVDRIRTILQRESDDWCGAPCPSKPKKPTPSIKLLSGEPQLGQSWSGRW